MMEALPTEPFASHPLFIPDEKAEEYNSRILASSSLHDHEVVRKRFACPPQERMSLLFFRSIFTRLGNQFKGECKEEDGDDNIPIEAFQRVFERLFYILGDDEGFCAEEYDENSNGFVGWGEFSIVFHNRAISIKWSLPERIYRTFDDPDSSILAQFVSIFVLLTITASSLTFILSTTEEFEKHEDFFQKVETVCLIIFCIEFLFRLSTCWAVRPEVLDKEKLLEMTVGDGVITLARPFRRFISFLIAPSNIIDLAAILPGILESLNVKLEGGGFVVLRLVRLTRVFRAFKNPTLQEPVIVIRRTMQQSTKALYILAFNLMLGILIFGTLIYEFEKGEEQNGECCFRRIDSYKNETSGKDVGVFEDSTTPFSSIPHAMWWAVVTATTVGYGDMFPVTTRGYVVATATMICSLVILALPIGVIGGNFTEAWDEVKEVKKEKDEEQKKDRVFITSAIQRIEPFELSRLMLIEVWNERFPPTDQDQAFGPPREGVATRPHPAEFLGEVMLTLDLTPNQDVVCGPITLPLRANREHIVDRDVAGSLTVSYQWKPKVPATEGFQAKEKEMIQRAKTASGREILPDLYGELTVTLVGADNLLNVCYSKNERLARQLSNPYCIVFCYPNSPGDGQLKPVAWRSSTINQSLSPRWESGYTWKFEWRNNLPQQDEGEKTDGDGRPACASAASNPSPEAMPHEIAKLLGWLAQEMSQTRRDMKMIAEKLPGSDTPASGPPAGRMERPASGHARSLIHGGMHGTTAGNSDPMVMMPGMMDHQG